MEEYSLVLDREADDEETNEHFFEAQGGGPVR